MLAQETEWGGHKDGGCWGISSDSPFSKQLSLWLSSFLEYWCSYPSVGSASLFFLRRQAQHFSLRSLQSLLRPLSSSVAASVPLHSHTGPTTAGSPEIDQVHQNSSTWPESRTTWYRDCISSAGQMLSTFEKDKIRSVTHRTHVDIP